MKIPPCANWNIWTGPEVEGQDTSAIGAPTLFVRKGDPYPYITNSSPRYRPDIKRVWFCKEFTEYQTIMDVADFLEVTLETTPFRWALLPEKIRANEKVAIFLKVDIPLRQGDHVCVGPAFADEAFVVGKERGNKVSVQDYLKDRRLE